MVDNQSKNFNRSLNLRTDFYGVNLKIENINGWSCQNFTELLNRPGKINSTDAKTLLKNTQIQIELDLDKFSDASSTKSEISQQSTGVLNKPFKVLIAENYTEYLERIKKPYSTFKFNHYSKYYTMIKHSFISNTSTYSNNQSSNILINLNGENPLKIIEQYTQSNKLKEISLSAEFMRSEREFKIDRIILEKKIDELEVIMRLFIEKGGVIEMEVQRILNHSSLIINYIENNLNLKYEVEFFLDRIKRHKEFKEIIKKSLIINTSKTIMRGNKKRKLENVVDVLKNMKLLKEIVESLRKVSNIQEENELIKKSKATLDRIKFRNLGIVMVFEKELIKYTSRSSEKIVEEFAKLFKKTFSDLITVKGEKKEINYVRNFFI